MQYIFSKTHLIASEEHSTVFVVTLLSVNSPVNIVMLLVVACKTNQDTKTNGQGVENL